jgi:hypothetical protein
MANPSAGLVKRLPIDIPGGYSAEVANDQKIGAIGRPVGPLNIFENFARSAASQRGASQRAHGDPGSDGFAVEQDRHLTGRRDRHQLRAA